MAQETQSEIKREKSRESEIFKVIQGGRMMRLPIDR